MYRFVVLTTLLAFAWLTSFSAPIELGKLYESGSRIQSEVTGISFDVPNGWEGRYEERSGSFVMRNKDSKNNGLISLFGFSRIDLPKMTSYVLENINTLEYRIINRNAQQTKKKEGQIYVEFPVKSNFGDDSYKLIGYSQQGLMGNGIVVLGIGSNDNPSGMKEVIEAVIQSVSWSKPKPEVKVSLVGKCYKLKDSVYYKGGEKRVVSEAVGLLDLCKDGTYRYKLMITQLNGSSIDETHSGKWQIVQDLVGRSYLELKELPSTRHYRFAELRPVKNCSSRECLEFDDNFYVYYKQARCK